VYVRERDFSAYVAAASTTVVGYVITSQRGPLNTPTLVTSGEEFLSIFGEPGVNMHGPLAVLNFLRFGNQAWVCRVARDFESDAASLNEDAVKGEYTILVNPFHTLNEGDYISIQEADKASSHNVKITAITVSGDNYLVTIDSPLGDDYSTDGARIGTAGPHLGAAAAEVFAMGRKNAQVVPVVKFTAKDKGEFANFGTSHGIEIEIQDGGQFRNIDPTSGLPLESDGIALQGMLPSAPSVDTKIDLLELTSPRLGETRGVNYDSIVEYISALRPVSGQATKLDIVIPKNLGWEAGNSITAYSLPLVSSVNYNGTYTVDSVSQSSSTETVVRVTIAVAAPGSEYVTPSTSGTRATGTLTTSSNVDVTEGETMTIGSKVYTFTASPTSEGDVLLGLGPVALLNLSRAINHTGTPGVDYVCAAAHPQVSAGATVVSDVLTITALTAGVAGNTIGITSGAVEVTASGAFMTGGADATDVQPYLENNDLDIGHRFGTVYRYTAVVGGNKWLPVGVLTKRVVVKYRGNPEEIFDNIVGYDPASPYHWDTVIGEGATSRSRFITAQYLGSGGEQPMSTYDRVKFPNNPRYVMGIDTQVRVSNSSTGNAVTILSPRGNNGGTPRTSDYIGVEGTSVFGHTGLKNFRKVEAYDINFLVVPGNSTPAVIMEMIAICEERHDCLALVDPPSLMSVQDVVDWHNGTGIWNDHSAFVSNKAALYYPWLTLFDPYSKREVLSPPSSVVPGVFAYSDSVGEAWFAAAGYQRGKVQGALRAEIILDRGDMDYMYGPGNGNAINSIATFAKDGIVVWGQRTLQRFPSALDRVNVRRLLFYIEKNVARAVRSLAFEQNDPVLWNQFKNIVEPMLQNLVGRRALEDFLVVCDATTNTPVRRNNNELYAKLIVIPVKTAEKIILDLTVLASGISVTEFATSDTGTTF